MNTYKRKRFFFWPIKVKDGAIVLTEEQAGRLFTKKDIADGAAVVLFSPLPITHHSTAVMPCISKFTIFGRRQVTEPKLNKVNKQISGRVSINSARHKVSIATARFGLPNGRTIDATVAIVDGDE